MKLIARDKNIKTRPPSEVIGITRDGWVVTKDGAFGDIGEDCEVDIEIKEYVKDFRAKHGLSQQELAWMLGKSRQTINTYERNNKSVTLRDFMIMASYMTDDKFEGLKRFVLDH